MRLLNRQVGLPDRWRPMLPMLVGALWILGFYTPVAAPFIYGTRWEISILFFGLAVIAILRQGGIRLDWASALTICLLLFLFVSTTYSFSPFYTFLRTTSALVLIASTFFVAQVLIKDIDDIRRMGFTFLILYALLLIVFYYSAATDSFAFASNRLQSNELFKATGGGNMLVSAGLLSIWYLKYCHRRYVPAVLIVIAVIGISVIMTRSRVPITGMIMSWPAAFVLFYGGRLTRGVIVLVIVSLMAGIYVYSSPETAKQLRVDNKELERQGYDMSTGRMERWEFLLDLGMQKPLLGHGFGTSRYARWRWTHLNEEYLDWTQSINNTETQQLAHNQHIQIFFELGVTGMILFWIILAQILKRGVLVTRLPNTPESFMLKMMFLSVCYHLLDSFSHDGLLSSGNQASYLFWMKAGFLVQGYRVLRLTEQSNTDALSDIRENEYQRPAYHT